MSKSPITCHVLDASLGRPAAGVQIKLQVCYSPSTASNAAWDPLAEGETDSDGRCLNLLPLGNGKEAQEKHAQLKAGGTYKIIFKTKQYFEQTGRQSFYPWVEIPFVVNNPDEHYHIPLLLSPYSYTTYRGS
ncbi:hypothetical protein K488DRAFT_79078 [Vararia minispora EC-137]|uniref:Uncharacterized protein n=1 Tax=Vararia minispora EC-137 TaxID=1314806 RepID=A0ACB8QIL9_9AGAM|nr:hypothetical protein K488DRAFT_79078 [Vararia minispora EC-137]